METRTSRHERRHGKERVMVVRTNRIYGVFNTDTVSCLASSWTSGRPIVTVIACSMFVYTCEITLAPFAKGLGRNDRRAA